MVCIISKWVYNFRRLKFWKLQATAVVSLYFFQWIMLALPQYIEINKYIGTKAIATGWGTLKEDGKPSCILQEVEVPILDNKICVENTNYTQKMITENMMCAGYPGVGQKDSCQVSSERIFLHLDFTNIKFYFCFPRVILADHWSRNGLTKCTSWLESFLGVINWKPSHFQWFSITLNNISN